MRYFKLRAEPGTSGLFDEHLDKCGYPLSRADIELPEEIWEKLEAWVGAYEPVLRLDVKEAGAKILQLDEEGLKIAEMIKSALPECKTNYFSYGGFGALYSKADLDEIRKTLNHADQYGGK